MARPKIKEPKKQYTIMIKPSVVAEIDRLSTKLDMSRSQLMANLVESGLDDAKILDKLMVLDLLKLGGKLSAKLKRKYISDADEIE